MAENFLLHYNEGIWLEKIPAPLNTLQLFITNKCNLRCQGCFYRHKLGQTEMSLEQYQAYLEKYLPQIQKVILLGGEPTLHPQLPQIIALNQERGIKTTIYSNGFNLRPLEKINLDLVKIRVGVYGAQQSEKPLAKVTPTELPLTIVYMLRQDNISELAATAELAEKEYNCQDFYISSIRDIAATDNYWLDTAETIPVSNYAKIIQNFVDNYQGQIKRLHLATRGVIITKNNDFTSVNRCRFGNIFPDQEKIICPLDISKKLTTNELSFDERACTKHYKCILQKIILEKITYANTK